MLSEESLMKLWVCIKVGGKDDEQCNYWLQSFYSF